MEGGAGADGASPAAVLSTAAAAAAAAAAPGPDASATGAADSGRGCSAVGELSSSEETTAGVAMGVYAGLGFCEVKGTRRRVAREKRPTEAMKCEIG